MPLVTLADERKQYSQNGEDGVIARLFDVLGSGTRTAVEIGCGDAACTENNTHALIEKGWRVLQLDKTRGTLVTTSNVAELLFRDRCQAPDLLSIDIDGQDYYVLDALLEDGVEPRVIVLEYNAYLSGQQGVPERSDFAWDEQTYYFGASLSAYAKMLGRHGYTLVYVEASGVNAFFIKTLDWAGLHWRGNPNRLGQPAWDQQFVGLP